MNKSIIIKQAKDINFLQIAQLDRVSWNDNDIDKHIPDGEHAWRLWVEYAMVYCCFMDDRIIGVALAFPTTKNIFAVHKIFIDRQYRGQGIGTLLFKRLITLMDKSKVNSFLTVKPYHKNAIKLYESMGYKSNQLIKGYYREKEDRFIMVRDYK